MSIRDEDLTSLSLVKRKQAHILLSMFQNVLGCQMKDSGKELNYIFIPQKKIKLDQKHTV